MPKAFSIKVFAMLGCLTLRASAQEPVALWAFPDAMPASQTARLGVVAYHQVGVSGVVFSVNGTPAGTVEKETINPGTGEMEFVLALDTAGYPEDSSITVDATVYPSDTAAPSKTLDARTVWIDNIPTTNIYFVDQVLGSDDTGTGASNAPYATIGKALSSASSGSEIRLRDGEYDLGANSSHGFTRFVRLYPDEGAAPKITSAGTLRTSYLHLEGLEFDWTGAEPNQPDGGISGNMLYGWSATHVRVENCTFHSVSNSYNNYLGAIHFWGSTRDITVENCRFHDLDLTIAGPNSGAILRGNDIGPVTRDAFDFFSDVLITGNTIHDIDTPHLYTETTNAEPFNVASADGLTFHYDEFNSGSYTTFVFSVLAAIVSNPAAATAEELAQAFMEDAAFSNKLEAAAEAGHIRVTARRSNYRQHLYVTGSANAVLGFPHDSATNQAVGSGQHSDIFQTWYDRDHPDRPRTNIIIRNNRAYNLGAQGLLAQSNIDNLMFVNNLIDDEVDHAWMLSFSGGYQYRNILLAHNTFWGSRNVLILPSSGYTDFTFIDNLTGPRGVTGDHNDAELTMDYNLYDYFAPGGGEGPSAHSLWTNPDKNTPTPTPLFANVTTYWDTETALWDSTPGYWEYIAPAGDFSLVSNSPARNAGTACPGIAYDINWFPRDYAPDIGAFEHPRTDVDADNLSDDWEIHFFADLETSDGTGNADGDTLTDGQEEIAGSDPTDSNSVFTVSEDGVQTGDGFIIRWPSVNGRLYSVDSRTNLLTDVWSNIESNIAPTPLLNTYTVQTGSAETLFNRVRIRKE